MINLKRVLSIVGLGLVVFSLASPALALDGYVEGYLRTFDLRNLRCDDSKYPCEGASKLQSEYNQFPAALPLKYVKIEIINASTNGNICIEDVHTSKTGYFRCNYRNVSGNPLTFLRVYWRDKNGRFKLANVFYNARGVAAVSEWFTHYPQSHGGGNIRLQGGAQRYSVNNDGYVYFYEDNVSSDDMEAANLYADTQLTFEKIAAGGANRFLGEIPTADGRMIIGIDRNMYRFSGDYAQAQGFCCYDESFATGQNENVSDLNDRVHPLLSPYIFEHYPYLTDVVHHEIAHSLHTLSSLYFHGEAIVPWAHGYSENCPRTAGYPWSITYKYNASCYQPAEALAEMFSTAVVFGQSAPPGEAKQVYIDGRIDGNPGEVSLEPDNCACGQSDGNRLLDGMRYFWDLYDTHRDGGNCQDENISLELWQVFEHVALNTMSDGEGSPYRLDYEAVDYRRRTCGDIKRLPNPFGGCFEDDEGGLFDMAHFAYDISTNWDYIDIWRNNCRSWGDYSWQYSGENQYTTDKRTYCVEKCAAELTVGVSPGGRLDGLGEAIASCADACVIEEE